MEMFRVALFVPRTLVKTVKTALEARSWLDRTNKITAEKTDQNATQPSRMMIPTKISRTDIKSLDIVNNEHEHTLDEQKELVLRDLGLEDLLDKDIDITWYNSSNYATKYEQDYHTLSTAGNPLCRALARVLHELPQSVLEGVTHPVSLVKHMQATYSIYNPMLLLPSNAFSSEDWDKLLSTYREDPKVLRPIWEALAKATGTTHIAVNAGIPPSTPSSSLTDMESSPAENILRAPMNLRIIHGDFGPHPTPQRQSSPTREDFDCAFWVSAVQNGIHQVWAPLYTMFSRGNIREKTRLLSLPSVLTSVSEGEGRNPAEPQDLSRTSNWARQKIGCTAVDLYAGIGYFAFSYKKAGVRKVLCWELNPWSVEGLRRGAELNGWTTQTFTSLPNTDEQWRTWRRDSVKNVDFLIFQQSNDEALRPVSALGLDLRSDEELFPPIRHVNCGFLPSSKLSWKTAVRIIDIELGGWIHAHENVGVHDIDRRMDEIVAEMQRYLDEWQAETDSSPRRFVKPEHVEKVKTYAPGVMHCVFDVYVEGHKTSNH